MSRKVINIIVGGGNATINFPVGVTNPGYVSNWITSIPPIDTSSVVDMAGMFSDCSAITTIPPIDTSNVENMASAFGYCRALTTIPPLNIEKVENTYNMFVNCESLANLNLINWKQSDIELNASNNITPLSIHNIISQAIGTETRNLILTRTVYNNWLASEYYDIDNAEALSKNINVQVS